jgi:hypothetical protein
MPWRPVSFNEQHLDEVRVSGRSRRLLAAEHGVTDHPKRALLYGKACTSGTLGRSF